MNSPLTRALGLNEYSCFYIQDKWLVYWYTHEDTANQAVKWCHEQFGDHWGELRIVGLPDRNSRRQYLFKFHITAHVEWFGLRWQQH